MKIPHDTHIAPIVGAYFDPWGSTYYRLALPLGAIGGAVAPFYDGVTEDQRDAAETIVVSRMTASLDSDLDALRRLIDDVRGGGRRRMVIDLDDDHRSQVDRRRRAISNMRALELCVRSADAVVVTNEVLRRRLRDLHRDIRVLPNLVRPEDWPAPAPQPDGPVTMVLAGSDSHADDWRIAAPALRRLKAAHPVRLRTVGYRPPYLADIVDEHHGWGGLDTYPARLAGAHIGLCPLPRTHFNEAKSPIKAYEFALSGMAVVASPCQYGPVLAAAGLGAYVVPDAGNWYPALESLVRDAEARQAAADTLRAHVCQTLDVRRHAETIRAAYAA